MRGCRTCDVRVTGVRILYVPLLQLCGRFGALLCLLLGRCRIQRTLIQQPTRKSQPSRAMDHQCVLKIYIQLFSFGCARIPPSFRPPFSMTALSARNQSLDPEETMTRSWDYTSIREPLITRLIMEGLLEKILLRWELALELLGVWLLTPGCCDKQSKASGKCGFALNLSPAPA